MKVFEKSEKSPKNLRFYINAVLTYLLIATIVFSAVSFAGYASKAIGSDSARVAKFDVNVEPDDDWNDIELSVTKAEGSNSFTVKNNSEVTVDYVIAVETDDSLPDGLSISAEQDSTSLISLGSSNQWQANNIAPGEENTYTIAVSLDQSVDPSVGEIDVSVTVIATQRD